MKFVGKFLDFEYEIEKETEAEFKIWLKDKILRYMFNMKEGNDMKSTKKTDSIELQVLKEILGIQQ